MTSLILGTLAVVLAVPAPLILARAEWPAKVPRAAVVLWQALALAAVLAALGAGVAVALDVVDRPRPGPVLIVVHLLALFLTAVVAVRLAWSAGEVAVSTRQRRRRHRELVDLLTTASAASSIDLHQGLRILQEETPIAYCVPGVRGSRVVVSSGALSCLTQEELEAVLAHERAHLRARHDLVLEAFTALREAFPLPLALNRKPLEQSSRLVEMLADDVARRQVGPEPIARALVSLATAHTAPAPTGALAVSGVATLQRVQRLAEDRRSHRLLSVATYLTAISIVVVPTLTVAIPLLQRVPSLMSTWLG